MRSSQQMRMFMLGLLLVVGSGEVLSAKTPLHWVTFRRNKAAAEKRMKLSEDDGPWLVFAASFAGEGAESEAKALIDELRERYRLPAYLFSEKFDFTETVEGQSVRGPRPMMVYDKAGVFKEYAVLVGNFAAIDDPGLQKTMKQLKYARPKCLTNGAGSTTRRFAGLREIQRRINGDRSKQQKGPMGNAFATPNPLIPREAFAPKGADSFVMKMNQDLEYSLLDCPGKFSVRVATFRGNVVIDQERVAEIQQGGEMQSRLVKAAEDALRLTEALRKKGIEAYQFHDRHESIVTVGSFDWVGRDTGSETKEMNPDVLAIVRRFSPERQPLVGKNGQNVAGLKPKSLDSIPFDIQPWPVEVPRRSVAADYARH